MGNEVKQKFTIQGVADVKDVIQGIDQIKSELGKLSLGPGLQSEFDKLFQRIEKNSEKANEAMASGFKNKTDVKRYTDAMDQIVNAYDNIITKAKILSNSKKIHLEADTSSLKTVRAELESLKTASDEARKAAVQAGKDLGTALKDAAKNHKNSTAASWNAAVESYKKGEIKDTENAIKTLENTIKVAQTKAQKNGTILGDDWQEKIKDVKAMREAFDKYITAQKNVVTSEDELKNKQQEENEILNRGAEKFREIATAGEEGAKGVRDFAKESSNAAKGSQQLNSELENFKGKAAYFFGLSNAINLFKRAVRSAYDTVKDLDAVMTETAVVTNFDVGDMWKQLPEYTQRANELGVSIHSAYEAATIFYQQGLKTNEVMAVSNETLKMARIAGLDAATASDRMTNALRGFNMEMDELSAKRVNDVYSKLAAITASNTDEISTAMTKVASLAHNANMEFETTSAFLAQMIETTRESAETAGTALKTVVARFSEVKKLYSKGELLGQDEEGGEIDVNKVSTALRSAGINLNEYLTGAKGLDDIFIELASKWDSLDKVQQRYIATMAAGSRQQSRFIAMMSDYGRTMELVDAANNANGASQEQYAKTLESLQTKLSRLKNAWDEFVLGLANSDVIKGAVDLLTNLITAINNLIKAVSGKNAGVKMITTFFMAFTTFKVGRKMFGGTQIVKIFDQLTNVGVQKAGQSAQVIAKYYTSSLEGSFSKTLKQDFGKGLDNNKLFNYFMPKKVVSTSFKIDDKEAFRQKLFNDTRLPFLDDEKNKAALNAAVDTGKIEEVNKVLKEQGSQLQINRENAEQFGVTCEDVTKRSVNSWGAAAAAAAAAGAIIMGFGDWIKSFGEEFETAGTIVKALGTGLLVFGTIMSVTLPLMAKAGAAGISAAIYSIPIIGWISAVISAVVALGAAIYGLYQNDKYENKLKEASDASKKAADAADEAAKAYENLGKSWDDLQDKYAAIDKATAGTQKWKDAIKEANDEAMQLVATYEGLDTKIDENGRLIVTEESKNAVQENLRNTKDMAQAAALGAQLNVNRVKRDNAEFNFRNYHDITGMRGETPEWKGRNGDTYTDEKVTEKLIESYQKGEIRSLEDLRMKATDYYSESALKDPWAYTSKITEGDFKALKEYVDTPSLEESSKAQINAMVSNALGKMSDKDAIKMGKNLISTDFANKIINNELDNVGKQRTEDKREEYAKNLGYKDYATWKVEANNNEDIKDKDLNSQLAAQRAQKKLNDFSTQFEGNMGKLTPEQLKFFQEEVGGALTKDEIDNLKGQGKDIYEALGGKEYFDKLGISEEEFIKKFDTDLGWASKNAEIEIKGLSEDLTGNLTTGARKALSENFESIFTASGQEGVDKIKNSITAITENLDPDKQKDFVKALTQIDWASANSVHELSDLAKEYGISEDAVDDLEEQIIKLNNAATKVDLNKVTDQLKSLLKIGKDISTGAQGRSFSEDQMNKLVEAGISKDKFVYNIQTGNFDYIGDRIQDVVDAINNQTNKMFDTKQLEKDEASGLAAKEVISNGMPENNSDKMAFIRDYVLKAGDSSKISTDMLKLARDNAANRDYSTADKLIAIIEEEAKALPEIQSQLNEYDFNKRVMKAQMNSGAENAGRAIEGDEAALKALMGQVSSSKMSEDLRQKLLSGMESGNEEERKKAIQQAGSITDTFTQAESFGTKTEDIEAYVKSLQQLKETQKLEEDELYRLALAEVNYQNGQQALKDSYDDWSKLIQKNGGIVPDGSIAQAKIFDQLNKDLKKMLNLTEDLPKDFLKAEGSADVLKKAIKGDKNAVTQLRKEAAKVTLKNFNLKISKDDTTEIENQIDKLAKEMPDLKLGTTLDSTKFGPALMEMVNKAGMSVDQIQKLFNGLGWAPEITWKKATVEDVKKTAQNGVIKQPDPNNPGKTIDVKLDGFDEWATTNDVFIPQVGGKTSYIAPKPPKTPNPKPKSKGKKGGGKKTKKERWENPYDELYNLQEKINESLRKREALERRYQKLLKQEQSSLSDIRKSYYDQIKQIRTEANLQKELEAGRRRQIENLGKQTYVDSKGNVKTFEQMGVTKYAGYNFETGQIELDWEGLQALEGSKNVEKGKAAEAFISKLEELVGSYEEVRDKLWELEDKIEEFREAAIDSYLSFEDRVMDALVDHYQKEIDSYQAMSDAIDKVNNEVLSSLREQVDLSRQIRDNTEKEEDISKKENRLAYLQRDTSGANDLEILSLQKELKDAREGYSDDLVDQAIDKMQDDADKASEQRQRQIEIMQTQLDIAKETGALWPKVYELMQDAAASEIFSKDSDLAKLLRDGEAWKSLSNIGKEEWWKEVGKSFREAMVGRDEAEDKHKIDADNNGTIADTGTSKTLNDIAEMNTQANVTADTPERTDEQNYGAAAAIVMGGKTHGGWGANSENWKNNLKEKGFDPGTVLDIVEVFNAQKKAWDAAEAATQKKNGKYKKGKKKGKWKYTVKPWTGWKANGVTDWTKYQMSRFATGGLADKTGPAWLDGTRSHPELVLNAQDTRNFIALKDTLASLMNPQNKANTAAAGNVYLDIDINADIGSDYDVDRLASRIKKQIFDEGQYRNINSINFLR